MMSPVFLWKQQKTPLLWNFFLCCSMYYFSGRILLQCIFVTHSWFSANWPKLILLNLMPSMKLIISIYYFPLTILSRIWPKKIITSLYKKSLKNYWAINIFITFQIQISMISTNELFVVSSIWVFIKTLCFWNTFRITSKFWRRFRDFQYTLATPPISIACPVINIPTRVIHLL